MGIQQFARDTLVVVAGDPGDRGSGKGLATEQVRPGWTGRYRFTDGQGTAHVLWDTGLRRGVEAPSTRLLRPVIATIREGVFRVVLTPDDTPCVIICISLAGQTRNGDVSSLAGQYLRAWDPEARDGYGDAKWTPVASHAIVYPSITAAHDAWRAIPRNRPRRDDGKPNRPLTAYNVVLSPAPSASTGGPGQ